MAQPMKGPMKGKGTIHDTKHSTNNRAAGKPTYRGAPYGKKKAK